MLVRSHFLFKSGILLSLRLHLAVKTECKTKRSFNCIAMLEYFLSPAKADLLPTDGGRPPTPTPLVTGLHLENEVADQENEADERKKVCSKDRVKHNETSDYMQFLIWN